MNKHQHQSSNNAQFSNSGALSISSSSSSSSGPALSPLSSPRNVSMFRWSNWRPMLLISLLLFVWFASSIVSTLINKMLMSYFPYPVTISAVHMLSSVLVDYFIVLSRGLTLTPFRRDVFWQCLPVAATINFGKTLTYVSYGMVPASLTHTAKASSPIFSVLLTRLMYKQWPSSATCLSLVPLTLGVILSALTEINLVFIGFLAAVLASLANVLNSIYTKQAISHVSCPDPIIFHMYTAATATLILLPWAFIKDAPDFFSTHTSPAAVIALNEINGLAAQDSEGYVAARLLLLSVSLHYLQNISSIYFLAEVSVLSHQVAQSLKRLMVISCSVFYFHTPVTLMNVVGMALALLGFFAYSLAKPKHISTARSHPNTPRRLHTELDAANALKLQHHRGDLDDDDSSDENDSMIDSYALVNQSELGSSHLLQSPSTFVMPERHVHSHSHLHSHTAHQRKGMIGPSDDGQEFQLHDYDPHSDSELKVRRNDERHQSNGISSANGVNGLANSNGTV